MKTPALVTLLTTGLLAAGFAALPAVSSAAVQTSAVSSHARPAACQTKNLYIGVGRTNGAAGTVHGVLHLTNTGVTTCTLSGYPGMSFTTLGHHRVGRSAQRAGARAHTITLMPGQVASVRYWLDTAQLSPRPSCRQKTTHLIKVYPPNQTKPVYLPSKNELCATGKARPGVYPVRAGRLSA